MSPRAMGLRAGSEGGSGTGCGMSCGMSSGSSCGPGMFHPGATVTLRVSAVSLHLKFPILRLWGLLGERGADYVRLQREIQAAAWPRLAASPDPSGLAAGRTELCVGELSLVEVVGVWHRCCVVSRHGHCYRVFLLDEGHVVVTSSYYLARGRRELFQLPPEVQGFVVADTLLGGGAGVVSGEDVLLSTCTEEAVKFLSCLHGKELSGLVQEVVNPQVIVLELPQLVTQMHHLGLTQKVTHSWFCQVLRCCLACDLKIQVKWNPPACSPLTPAVPQHPCVLPSYQAAAATSDYFYPRLQLGVTEPVLVTHVSDPHHVYCQLQSMSQEICCLSDTMRHMCHQGEQGLLPRVGSACAARGRDGQWYRALLLELIAGEQEQQLALVIFVDYGRKETVSRANLCHLPVECFRMPVVTYACALQGVSDRGCGWSPSQIDALKALVLGKGVSARIDMFNSFEHLYYVSMFGENGINLNCLFGVEACCLVSQSVAQEQLEVEEFPDEELDLPAGPPSVALTYRDLASSLAGVHQKLGVFHGTQVSYIRDPSEFWLQLREHCQLFRQLRQSMWSFYFHAPKLDDAGQYLQPGSLCCVKGKDGAFYRAVITAVQDSGVETHLLDRGSMETVDPCVVKELVSQFRELPALALKCCLAGVTPLRGSWSELSVSAFRELVQNKALRAHFLSVQGDKYMVDVFDESHLGEKSVSKLLAQGGFAECQGCEMPKALQSLPDKAECWAPAGEKSQVNAEERLSEESDLKRNGGTFSPRVTVMVRESPVETVHSSSSEAVPAQKYEGKENLPVSQTQNDVEIKPSSSYRCQLKVGSTTDVVVSYIENPGYFWCQLSRTNQDLQLLMAEIQEYCKNSSQPRAWPDSLCLAQYSGDKKWYRAVITGKVSCAEKVEVVFVDFGNRVLVSLADLRSAHERFLKLEAQAFRCSLYNLIQANGLDPFAWDKAAIQAFQEFVDTSSCFKLKCTVFALASINNELFNIVDLMTPFQSICQFLTDRGVARHLASQKCLVSSVQLHSYYYSMHGIKIGTKEDIFITHVEDLSTFYCQLERCAGHLAQLDNSIRQLLSQTMTSRNTLQKCGTLCLAKYTDNHWYRGVITKTEPNMEVFFVDFGNTETMEKDHLLPLPSDACDVLLLPMQAIKCSLFDTAFVHKEATTWFKEAVLKKQLKAIVVGRESDGKLCIELYDGNTQINAKLKEKFCLISSTGLYRPVENEALCSRNVDVNESGEAAESPLDAGSPLEREENRSEAHEGKGSSERHFKEDDVNLFQPDWEGELAAGLLESDEVLSTKSDGFLLNKAGEESLLPVQMGAQSDTIPECIMLQTGANLLQQKVVPALKVSVYLSYVNNPLDFYVQLESDEGQLNSISESLNDGTQAKDPCGQLLQAGDLISAVYSEDNLWYRAVVKEKISGSLVSVQYIDYGNTSVINVDQVHRLPEDLASIPAIGIHCFLGGLKNTAWTEKAALDFTKRTSDHLLLTCEFVEKVEDQWEVILTDHQGIITVDLADENLAGSSGILDRGENSAVVTVCEPLLPQAQNEISCVSDSKSFLWKFPVVGQTLKMYVTVADSPEYFWSRSADPEDMNYMSYIQKKIEEAENFGLKSWNDCRSCIKSGDICLVKYSQGGKFYRAEVSSVKGEKVFVRYVDYGIEEAVSMAMVKQIPCELLKVPNQAFACCLSGFNSSEGSWLNEAKEQFYCMTKDLLLEAEVIDKQEDKASEIPLSVVKLEASGKSINEEMKSFWKANKGTGDRFFSNLENPLNENGCSNKERGVCIKRETTAVGGLAQGESESAWLCSETFLGVTSEFLHAAEANGSGGAVGFMPWKAGEGCETTDRGSSFEETLLPVGEGGNHFLPEPMRSCSLRILGSERKAAGQELPEVSFQEDAELQAELTGSVSAARLFLGDGQEPQRLPVLPGQSSSDETGAAAAVDHLLQMSPTYGDLKEFILQLAKKMALNLYETYKAEALQEAWLVEPPSLRLPSSSDRPQKQLDLKTHSVLSGLGAEMEQLLVQESVVQPSQEDGKELEHAALQSSAGCGSPFSFLTEGFTSQRPVGIAKSRGCKVEKQEEWQKKYDCCVEEWMEQDLTEGGNTHVQSSDFKPGPEEVEKKQNGNLADCTAEHHEYTCHLKGFAVGSKCVVWTSLKWCEALILEISERGTKVLNLTSGTEEVVDPENVWNGIPGWASGSAEAMTSAAENSQSLPEESLL